MRRKHARLPLVTALALGLVAGLAGQAHAIPFQICVTGITDPASVGYFIEVVDICNTPVSPVFLFSADLNATTNRGTLEFNTNLSDPCGPDVSGNDLFSCTSHNSFRSTITLNKGQSLDLEAFEENCCATQLTLTPTVGCCLGAVSFSGTSFQQTFVVGSLAQFTIRDSAVPEPSTWLMLAVGSSSLWWSRRKVGRS